MIVDKKDEKAAGRISEAIKKTDAKVKIFKNSKNSKTIHISNLNEITKKEEVEEAIQKVFGEETAKQVVVGNLRPAARGTQRVSIVTTSKVAMEMLKEGAIKIGLSHCRMEERVEIQR